MGYRSEVAYRIVFDTEEVMQLFITEAKVKEETERVFKDAEEDGDFPDGVIRISVREKEISFHATGWKWYDEYPQVQAHLALLDLAREYNIREVEVNKTEHDGTEVTELQEAHDIQYAFARIGEEQEDVDTWGSDDYWELLDVERRIVWN